jgi:hypothetical protein
MSKRNCIGHLKKNSKKACIPDYQNRVKTTATAEKESTQLRLNTNQEMFQALEQASAEVLEVALGP